MSSVIQKKEGKVKADYGRSKSAIQTRGRANTDLRTKAAPSKKAPKESKKKTVKIEVPAEAQPVVSQGKSRLSALKRDLLNEQLKAQLQAKLLHRVSDSIEVVEP